MFVWIPNSPGIPLATHKEPLRSPHNKKNNRINYNEEAKIISTDGTHTRTHTHNRAEDKTRLILVLAHQLFPWDLDGWMSFLSSDCLPFVGSETHNSGSKHLVYWRYRKLPLPSWSPPNTVSSYFDISCTQTIHFIHTTRGKEDFGAARKHEMEEKQSPTTIWMELIFSTLEGFVLRSRVNGIFYIINSRTYPK